MARKARSPRSVARGFTVPLLLLLPLAGGCRAADAATRSEMDMARVDVSEIPADTVDASEPLLVLQNGVYFLDQRPFSGFVRDRFGNGSLERVASYARGRKHGITRTYYTNGQIRDVRSYRDNLAYGRHVGYWEDGTPQFDFLYVNDRREGIQKQWYQSGAPYAFLTFHDDREAGMQQAWRESGRPYINYEVRDGIRYGLQKSVLCYTIKDGAIK